MLEDVEEIIFWCKWSKQVSHMEDITWTMTKECGIPKTSKGKEKLQAY